jgi:hypothetical protein
VVKTGIINVGPYVFDVATSGSGVGDLLITPIPPIGAPASTQGYTLVSFATAIPTGSDPVFGLIPDAAMWPIFGIPASPGNPLHYTVVSGAYPDVPFGVPPGTLTSLAGLSADFVQVGLDAAFTVEFVSNVDSVTF